MKSLPTVAALAALGLLSACSPAQPSSVGADSGTVQHEAEVVVAWNEALLGVAEAEDGFLTLKGVRGAALTHLAMHDALQAIERRYEPYLSAGEAPGANPIAAVAKAACVVATVLYPNEEARFAEQLSRWLDSVEDGAAKQAGLRLGEASASAILAARTGDGWDGEAEYQWHPMAPGVYAEFQEHSGTPDGFIFGAGWAAAKPFALTSPSHFRSPPPPAIDSEAYAEAYDEVREVGRFESDTRTVDQTHLALWWKQFVEKSHNRLSRELVVADGLELWAAARLFALLNVSIYDGYVNVFDNKFLYNHWRPYTAIRWAANDGNPATQEEADWNNTHRHTYAFPSYPSAHGTVCAAAMTVLTDQFGDARPITMTTLAVDSAGPFSEKVSLDPTTRSFDNFSSAAMECSLSRVYLGIHFRYDSIVGNELGRQVGEFAVSRLLRPVEAG